jgi:hypothetical protein
LTLLAALVLLNQAAAALPVPGFVENRGQWPEQVRYVGHGDRITVWCLAQALVIDVHQELPGADAPARLHGLLADPVLQVDMAGQPPLQGCAVWLEFTGASPYVLPEARGPFSYRCHFYGGRNPGRWRSDVPTYSEIVYRDLWPGIDLIWRIAGGEFAYEVVTAPGGHPEAVRFTASGATAIAMDGAGNLDIQTPLGRTVRLSAFAGVAIPGGAVTEQRGGGGVARAMPNKSIQDDTPLLWSTLVGGSSDDLGRAIALDEADNPVLTGCTESHDFPDRPGLYTKSRDASADVYVLKLNATASAIQWITFLYGSEGEVASCVALDGSGHPVIAGHTQSVDFPTTPGVYGRFPRGGLDLFAARLDAATGLLAWSSYLGGSELDRCGGLALDALGNPFLTGSTQSPDFPLMGPVDPDSQDSEEAFVAKLSADGTSLLWSTYLGGGGSDSGQGLALDALGNAVIVGWTGSLDFPTTAGAFDTSYNGYHSDVFVAKLDTLNHTVLWGTYLGGYDLEEGYAVALDPAGNPVLTGQTSSPDFPVTPEAYSLLYNGGQSDAFVAKLSVGGDALLWSSFLGGSDDETGLALTLDGRNQPVVAGVSGSVAGGVVVGDFPVTPDGLGQAFAGGYGDVFLCKLAALGDSLLYGSFLGGEAEEVCYALTLDSQDDAVLLGQTTSTSFPVTPGAYDVGHNGEVDLFVSKLNVSPPIAVFLEMFLVESEQGGIRIRWRVAQPTSPADFRLTASGDAGSWNVTFRATDPRSFLALDTAPLLCEVGSLVYSLSWRRPGGRWEELACERIAWAAKPASTTQLMAAFPNPFNPRVAISYALAQPGRVEVAVFDLQGHSVAVLVDDLEPAGTRSVTWNGLTDRGQRAPAGVYLVRMTTAARVATAKILLAR